MMLIAAICLIAAFIELDNVSLGQTGIGRPCVSGIIFGYLMGNVGLGAELGILLELLFLDFTPVGGVLPPNGTVAALCAVMAASYGAPCCVAFFYGVCCGMLFRFVEMKIRSLSGSYIYSRQEEINKRPLRVLRRFVWGSMAVQVLITFTAMFGAVYAAKTFLYYSKPVNDAFYAAFNTAYLIVPWLGVFILFKRFGFKAAR